MNSITQTATIINVIPQRISAEHYQTASFTDPNKTYDQIYDYNLKRWLCNCGDAVNRHNPNCKHNILLRAFIKREKAQQASEHHSSSAELIQILTRISNLENAMSSVEVEQRHIERDLDEHQYQLDTRAEQERALRLQLDQQAKQIERLMDLVGALQSSVCKLNERTISQDETIKSQQRQIEDQAQQIDKLHEAVNQQKPEQVVRVVIDQLAPRQPQQARQERQPAEDTAVKQVSKTECKVGKFTVRVQGNCAAGCDCSIGIMDRQCPHMVKVDQFLSK